MKLLSEHSMNRVVTTKIRHIFNISKFFLNIEFKLVVETQNIASHRKQEKHPRPFGERDGERGNSENKKNIIDARSLRAVIEHAMLPIMYVPRQKGRTYLHHHQGRHHRKS